MPLEELKPIGQTNQAPAKQAPDTAVNTFNAQIGQAFKCNICGAKHGAGSKDPIYKCLKKGFNNLPGSDVVEIYPYKILVSFSRSYIRTTISTKIDNDFLSIFLHIIPITVRMEDDRYFNISKVILAQKDFNQAIKDNLSSITGYSEIISEIKNNYKLLKEGGFRLTHLRKTDFDDYNREMIAFNNPVIVSRASYVNSKISSISKELNGDIYLLSNTEDNHKEKLLLRLSLWYRYLPKYGLWDNIDIALADNPPETWQIAEQIFFPERMVDINAY